MKSSKIRTPHITMIFKSRYKNNHYISPKV